MRTQQEAERAEQQRIKNLVLNYDLRDDDSNDGGFDLLQRNSNRSRSVVPMRYYLPRHKKDETQSVEFNNPPTKKDPSQPLFTDRSYTSSPTMASVHKQSITARSTLAIGITRPSPLSYASCVTNLRNHHRENAPRESSEPVSRRGSNGRTTGVTEDRVITHADHVSSSTATLEMQSPYTQPRIDKSGTGRNQQRARKLQLSDVDWYV